MTTFLLRLSTLASLVILLAACGSSPRTNYYVLNPAPLPAASGTTPSLGIGPVEIPEYLSRERIMFQSDLHELELSDSRKWAEPLEDGVTRVLALNLSSLADTQDVRFFPWHPKRAPDYGIKVNIMSMDATPDGASMTAEWLIYRTDSSPVLRRINRLQQPLADLKSGSDIAAAYSALLLQLSELVAAAIEQDLEQREASAESAAP